MNEGDMARSRIIKVEFWDDEKIGSLSIEARLLFIGMWNFADDEGLIRFNNLYLKSSVFMYDSVSFGDIDDYKNELINANLVLPYADIKNTQHYAYIINFLKYQKINRPTLSKLPPPPIHDKQIIKAYAARDGMACYICNELIEDEFLCTHVVSKSKGGTDHPSNIKIVHPLCKKKGIVKPSYSSYSSQKQKAEINEIVFIWNKFADENNLAKIIKISDKRKTAILARAKEKEFVIGEIFEKIKHSKFLLGGTKDWEVDFDFIFCSRNNYLKILEGKYDNHKKNLEQHWANIFHEQ